MTNIKVGIIGGSGWTGAELLRLLLQHPNVALSVITSRSLAGKPLTALFPNLLSHSDLSFADMDISSLEKCDVVFFATPHGVAMQTAPVLVASGIKVIDLGADFRVKDVQAYEQFYNIKHSQKSLLAQAVYGLTEVNRSSIKTAKLVANPGCYPTVVSLALLPLLNSNCINVTSIIADCKSGLSGAGRALNKATSLCEASETIKAYGVSGHRHLPEIEQILSQVANTKVSLTFIPHLTPMIRGMLATIYVDLSKNLNTQQVLDLFNKQYQDEPFIEVLPKGQMPETRAVKGSNKCHIGIQVLANDKLIIIAAIDNLLKGASAQAVQNMNIMFGLPQTSGLTQIGIMP